MNAKTAQKELKRYLSKIFGEENIHKEWRSRTQAEDWLKFGNIYAPRPDIAVGPFNIEEGIHTSAMNGSFVQHRKFFDQLSITNSYSNKNPRCLIAIEIENSNKGKHMLGNIINASLLGKVGIIITPRDEFFEEAERIFRYLKGAYERKKIGHNPSNVVIKKYEEIGTFQK